MLIINPEEMKQWADWGQAMYNALPEEAKQNLFVPATKEAGKGLASLATIFSYPANSLALSLNHKLAAKQKMLENEALPKIEALKEQGKYTEDGAGLAIKALEESKYSLDSEVLRSYFSELIANSLNSEKINTLSPNFANILGSFTESEALFLKNMVTQDGFIDKMPIAAIRIEDAEGSGFEPVKDIVSWSDGSVSDNSKEIATLISFGILSRWHKLTGPDMIKRYDTIQRSHFYTSLEAALGKSGLEEYKSIRILKTSVELTNLGRSFVNAVLPNEAS